MILAERAPQITAVASDRQNQTPRVKPGERFFLYGIQGERGDPAVICRRDLPVPADSCPAEAGPAFLQIAVSETDLSDSHRLPPPTRRFQ